MLGVTATGTVTALAGTEMVVSEVEEDEIEKEGVEGETKTTTKKQQDEAPTRQTGEAPPTLSHSSLLEVDEEGVDVAPAEEAGIGNETLQDVTGISRVVTEIGTSQVAIQVDVAEIATLQAGTKTMGQGKTDVLHLPAARGPPALDPDLARPFLEGLPCPDVVGGPILHLDVVAATRLQCLVAVDAIHPRFRAGEGGATPRPFPGEVDEAQERGEEGMIIPDRGVPLQGGVAGGVVLVVVAAGAGVGVWVQGGGGGTIEKLGGRDGSREVCINAETSCTG
jgi:hypothetical protein